MREDLWFAAVPVLLAVYAVARPIDGRDGEYGPGLAWNVGHLAFLGAVLGVAAVAVALWRRSPRRQHPGVVACALAALVGVALFCWVILTDLVPAFDERAPLPEPLMAVGPPLFVLGFVGTLAVHCALAGVRWWPVPPLLVLAGLLAVGADLDLLPVTAVLVGAGLLLVVFAPRPSVGTGRSPA